MFCIKFNIDYHHLKVADVLAFIEVLACSKLACSTIHGYMSAIKAIALQVNIDINVLYHKKVSLMLRSCSRTLPFAPNTKQILSPMALQSLIQAVSNQPMGILYKALFLVAFHGFLRISNLLPRSSRSFLPLKHLTRGDVLFSPPGVHIILKWSKTLQTNANTRLIPLAAVPGSILCPVQALRQLHSTYPVPSSSPLFSRQAQGHNQILTQTQARAVLNNTLQALGLDPSLYGFHTFRRSGASLAFSLQVPLQYIKSHGTWASDSVWQYLHPSQHPSVVATSISTFLSGLGI